MMKDRNSWYPACRPCGCAKPEMPPVPWSGGCFARHEKGCGGDSAMSMKLFCGGGCRDRRDVVPAAPPVNIVNPWNCNDRAVVYLGIDECGNLVVSVRRDGC